MRSTSITFVRSPFSLAALALRRSPRARAPRGLGLVALCALAASPRALAQCAEWDASFADGPARDGFVSALAVFDDGAGPALFAAGDIGQPGGVGLGGLAKRTDAGWIGVGGTSPLGIPAAYRTLAIYDLGQGPTLYAGGAWAHISVSYPTVAYWTPSGWATTSLPAGAGSATIAALAGYDDGSGPALYAGGTFWVSGYQRIARWNGSGWSVVGSSVGADAPVRALCVHDDGSGPALYVGGEFTSIGGIVSPHLARWDGAWSAVGAPLAGTDGPVDALAVHDDGSGPALYAGGSFATAGGIATPYVARLQGGAWSAAGASPPNGRVRVLARFRAGDRTLLVAGGSFTAVGATPAARIAVLDEGAWAPLGLAGNGLSGEVQALTSWDDDGDGSTDLDVGGSFAFAGSTPSMLVAQWNGCTSEAYCFGDGIAAGCPCANTGLAGHGCDNSASTGGARLDRSGTTVADALVLTQDGELASALSIFLQGSATTAPVAFGDGLRCIGGNLLRLYVANAVGGSVSAPGPGDPTIRARSAALGDPIEPASVRSYQVYYRDPALAFCPAPPGGTFNVGNALRVVW